MTKEMFIFALFSSCGSVRDVVFCKVDATGETENNCARNGERFTKPLSELDGWFATDEAGLRKIADKLESCERDPNGSKE